MINRKHLTADGEHDVTKFQMNTRANMCLQNIVQSTVYNLATSLDTDREDYVCMYTTIQQCFSKLKDTSILQIIANNTIYAKLYSSPSLTWCPGNNIEMGITYVQSDRKQY